MSKEKTILDLEHAAANLEGIHLDELAVPLRRVALHLRNMDHEYRMLIDDMNGDTRTVPHDRT
jgi:hypothetical protein